MFSTRTFDILGTQCGMHVAHDHSTHAKAFTLLKFYRRQGHCARPWRRSVTRARPFGCGAEQAAAATVTAATVRALNRFFLTSSRPSTTCRNCKKALRDLPLCFKQNIVNENFIQNFSKLTKIVLQIFCVWYSSMNHHCSRATLAIHALIYRNRRTGSVQSVHDNSFNVRKFSQKAIFY